jgi:hypothetical protein
LNFHLANILLPPSIVEHVLVHELAHLQESNYTPELWRRLEWGAARLRKRKTWLAEKGMALTL